jgi:hypothetical protein
MGCARTARSTSRRRTSGTSAPARAGFYRDLVQWMGVVAGHQQVPRYEYGSRGDLPSGAPARCGSRAGQPGHDPARRRGAGRLSEPGAAYRCSPQIRVDGAFMPSRPGRVSDREELYWNNLHGHRQPVRRGENPVTARRTSSTSRATRGRPARPSRGTSTPPRRTASFTGTIWAWAWASAWVRLAGGIGRDIAPILRDRDGHGSQGTGDLGGARPRTGRRARDEARSSPGIDPLAMWDPGARFDPLVPDLRGAGPLLRGLPLGIVPANRWYGLTSEVGAPREAMLWRVPPVTVRFTPPEGSSRGGGRANRGADGYSFSRHARGPRGARVLHDREGGRRSLRQTERLVLRWNRSRRAGRLAPYERRAMADLFGGKRPSPSPTARAPSRAISGPYTRGSEDLGQSQSTFRSKCWWARCRRGG